LSRSPLSWQFHAADVLDQLTRNFSTCLSPGLDLFGGLGRRVFFMPVGEGRVSWNIGRSGYEVVHQDVIGTGEFFIHQHLAVGNLG
jgi:hypothetical protein